MRRPRKDDIFAPLRRRATAVLNTLASEIAKRESQLHTLRQQADAWRSVLGGGARGPVRGISAVRNGRVGRPGPAKRGAARIDWDQVLVSVPKRFGVDDVMKHPGARAKGRPQIYPALTRWEAGKKIRRVGTGQYEKVSGRGPGRPSGARKTVTVRKPLKRRAKAGAKRPSAAKSASRKTTQNGRVDWDAVLKALPAKFDAADVLKNPAAAAKGQAQVYPAIGRWVATKKIKKVAKGQYQRV